MKKLLLFFLLAIILLPCEAKKHKTRSENKKSFPELQIDSIRKVATDDTQYATLQTRFEQGDSLSIHDIQVLYSGRALRKSYRGDYHCTKECTRLIKEGRIDEASNLCNSLLDGNPVSLRLLRYKIEIALSRGSSQDELKCDLERLRRLVDTILASGDGSAKTPYKVICVDDEYELLYHVFETSEIKSQSLIQRYKSTCDILTIGPCKHIYKRGVIIFDVTLPHATLSSLFSR